MTERTETYTCSKVAEAVLDYLSSQTYSNEPILHAIIACDFVSRQRMVAALQPVIYRVFEAENAELPELRKDKARLDWMIEQSNAGEDWLHDAVFDLAYDEAAEAEGNNEEDYLVHIRTAIDKAMERRKVKS